MLFIGPTLLSGIGQHLKNTVVFSLVVLTLNCQMIFLNAKKLSYLHFPYHGGSSEYPC